ncbi:MAG: hypothetical protein LKJ04_00200 [Lactobacillus sp.]|jgi:hypothetical protein|nr:hypothetical protein [Lactobacillus sp.]
MRWILLLIVIIVVIVYVIKAQVDKKKDAAKKAEVQSHEDKDMIIAEMYNANHTNHLALDNQGQLFYNLYHDGKEPIPGGATNFTIFYENKQHVTLLTLLNEGSQDFGDVEPAATEKFLEIFHKVGGHVTTKCHYIELNEDDMNDLKLHSKEMPAHFYFYVEEVEPNKKRIFFSSDPNSIAYELIDLVAVKGQAEGELHRINMTLQTDKGQTFSIYTALSDAEVADLMANYLSKK